MPQPAKPAAALHLFSSSPAAAAVGSAAPYGTAAALAVSADLNGDGIPDDVVSNLGTEVGVFLGNSDGSEQTGVYYNVGTDVSSITIADVNRDGKPDVVVTAFDYPSSNYVSVLLGNGDGTLQAPQNFSVGLYPESVAIGDFNGDGKPDLAVAADDALYLLLGNGDGTFQAPVSLLAGSGLSVVAADLNGDGKLDVALGQPPATSGDGTVVVLLGKGNGTFQNPISTDAGVGNADFLGFGDFNGDGIPDMAISHEATASISIRLGNGNGTFQTGNTYLAAENQYYPGFDLLDLYGDGNLDFVVTDGDTGVILNLFGNGDGTFQAPIYYSAPGAATSVNSAGVSSVAAADFNLDGKLDLATSDGSIWLGNGSGQFTLNAGTVPSGMFLAAGDFNGDGKPDLATSSGVALGNGSGTFGSVIGYPAGLSAGYIVTGDFNGDGKLDLAVAPGNPADLLTTAPSGPISILLGNGDGTFRQPIAYNAGAQPYAIATGDFNGDGKLDLAVADYGAGALLGADGGGIYLFLGNGDGTFTAGASFSAGQYPLHLAAADVNGDGKLDLVVATTNNGITGALAVFLGNGNATFAGQPLIPTATGDFPQWISILDLNGDGIPDITESENGGDVGYLQGNGDGTFQSEIPFPAGSNPLQLLTADFNGDGRLDLAVADDNSGAGGGGFVVLLNQPQTTSATPITIQTSPAGLQFSVDGTAYTTAQTLNLSQGTHTIAVTSPQAGAAGTQYVFASWSDGGAASHSITVGSSPATYTATFQTQYQLSISASPAGGGTVTPASGGFYNAGTAVNISATPNSGYIFSGWTGPAASASSASTTVTMSAPETVIAGFSGSSGSCSLTLGAAGASLPPTGTSTIETCPNNSGQPSCGVLPETAKSFTVSASAGCGAWTATSSNPEFLQITAGATGTGAGSVSYTRLTNTHNAAQNDSITVASGAASATYSITEAGNADSEVYRQIYVLYEQLLGRDPDAGGFAFWSGGGGAQLGTMADDFLTSPEAFNSDFAVMAAY
ncbi:MAG TPA: FG-GAP-like repeat-containing protein, partial [Bryobacteraceae bacterium]|nr:FG-GAP-like repeat-containing protein [Bryobacteraceae bacterium]